MTLIDFTLSNADDFTRQWGTIGSERVNGGYRGAFLETEERTKLSEDGASDLVTISVNC